MAKFLSLLFVLLFAACNNQEKVNDETVKKDTLLQAVKKNQPGDLLTGKWAYARKGSGRKTDGSLFIVFRNNHVATLNGPDNEFERVKWRMDPKKGLIITGLKKYEDSGWTFRDSVFKYVFSQDNTRLELTGKRQAFLLKKVD